MSECRAVGGLSLPAGAGGCGEDIDHHRGRQAGTVRVLCPNKKRRGGAIAMIGTPHTRLDIDRERHSWWLETEGVSEPLMIGRDGVRNSSRHIPAPDTRQTIVLLLVV